MGVNKMAAKIPFNRIGTKIALTLYWYYPNINWHMKKDIKEKVQMIINNYIESRYNKDTETIIIKRHK